MHLSELRGITVVRDGTFQSLGLGKHRRTRMLVPLDGDRYVQTILGNSYVACVLTTPDLAERFLGTGLGVAVCARPMDMFYDIHDWLLDFTEFYGKPFDSIVHPRARVEGAYIAPKNVIILPDVVVEPNATILAATVLEERVVIRAGAVIGTEGYQVYRRNGRPSVIRHAGGVMVRHDVEIQALTAVSKDLFGGDTVIGAETKIHSLVGIAHNVKIGERCRITGNVRITGATVIGDDVYIGPSACVIRVVVGDGAFITAGSVVTQDVPAGAKVTGNFAIPHERFLEHLRGMR